MPQESVPHNLPTYDEPTLPVEDSPMEQPNGFSSPEEELEYLRAKVAEKEAVLAHRDGIDLGNNDFEKSRATKRAIKEYATEPPDEVLEPQYAIADYESSGMALGLEPEDHDKQVDELLWVAHTRGIKNALTVAQKLNNPHLEDDFHRVLVQYVAEGVPTKGLRHGTEQWQAMHMTLYEVSLPRSKSKEESKEAKELEKLLGAMEQFYLGMLAMVQGKPKWYEFFATNTKVFTVELAVKEGSEEAVFYVAVPRSKRELFERHMLSIYPDVVIEEQRNDYNIFNQEGEFVAAEATLERPDPYPIKVYKHFTHDPLNVILAAFSKMRKHGEGLALQFVIGDDGAQENKRYKKILAGLRKGENEQRVIMRSQGFWHKMYSDLKDTLLGNKEESNTTDQNALELISAKASKRVVPVVVRAVASAGTLPRAQDLLDSLTSTFNQFDEAQGNGIVWKSLKKGALRNALRAFTFRTVGDSPRMPLSVEELTTMAHLTGAAVSTSRELKQNTAKHKPAPIAVGDGGEGIVLGKNLFGGKETRVHFAPKDRMRHFYEIGQTGTGKSFLMKQMIMQDIRNGDGCCYIDPHGSDILDVLASVPEHRHKDVIYFDPGHTTRPMGLNFLEFDPKYPEQKTFVVNELFSIFFQLFGKKSPESMGPMFEQYFRNSTMLVLEGMEPGTATIGDISRVLSDKEFRHKCLDNSNNPVVNQFWREVAEKAGGDASLENVVPYIVAKTDIFMANEIMRPIIAQSKSAFNFRHVMDEKKILLVNLSKGRIGDINSELLGLLIVGKLLQAALSRVDVSEDQRAPFYLYIDEFQNFTTPSISTILSEARKYALSLNLAHQFIKQLDEKIRDAVFGNVGTKCVFRVSQEDAEFLEKEFQPEFTAGDIAGLPNRNAYLHLLVDGSPASPFDMQTMPIISDTDFAVSEKLKQLSYERYGRPREEVEAEIADRYAKKKQAAPADPFADFPGF